MKKTILVMLVAVFGMGFVNAQIYVGGSLGFTSGNTDPENGDKLGTSSFSFSPEVGYSLSPDFEVGIALEILNEKEDLTPDTESKSSGWGLAPYARYSFVEFGKFSVWGSAALAFGGGETGVGDNTEKFTAFGLDIHPVLKYDLSDKFTLLTNLNFLNIGFTQVNVKDAATVTNFGLGVDAGDVATLGAINIGFLYKF